jgi:hypothetical protein
MNLQRVARLLQDKYLVTNEVILKHTQEGKGILFGAKAYNYQSPPHLRKKTIDYDVLIHSPKKVAIKVANELKRRLDDNTKVVKGSHRGTFRVQVNGQNIADFTQLKSNKSPKIKRLYGLNVRDLKSIKRNAIRLSHKKGLEYRREKDLDTINKVQEIERLDKIFNSI